MAASKRLLDEIRAEESGAARDKNSGHPVSEGAARPTGRDTGPAGPVGALIFSLRPGVEATQRCRVLRARRSHGTRILCTPCVTSGWRTRAFGRSIEGEVTAQHDPLVAVD